MDARTLRLLPVLAALAVAASGCGLAAVPDAPDTVTGPQQALTATRTAAAAGADDVVDVRPLPGSVVGTQDVGLRALLVTDEAPSEVAVTIDGVPVEASTEPAPSGVQVTAVLGALEPGDRQLSVSATYSDNTDTRSWPVTAAEPRLDRLAGPDRFATAVTVSQHLHPRSGEAPAAVLARSDDFADALAGGPLAAHLGGPLLLTRTAELPQATADELARVLADDAAVHVLGGPAAISTAVEDAIVASGHEVVRHQGSDRYATAARVAAALPASETVVVAAGTRFPDALAASVPAARDGWPVLLTPTNTLADATATAIETLGPRTAIVVGGEVAVSEAVAQDLDEVVADVERVSGPDRYATAVAVAETFFDDPREVALASGLDYPDALGAATRASGANAPLLLVDPLALPDTTSDALRRMRSPGLVVHGGPAAISQDVAAAAHHAVVDGPDAPRVVATVPDSGESSASIAPIEIVVDRPLDPATLVAAVTLDDVELPTDVRLDDTGSRVVVDPLSPGDLPLDEARDVHVVLRAADVDGRVMHHTHTFVLREDRAVFAVAAGLELLEPSRATEFVGYHQSNHEGARQMEPSPTGPPWTTLEHRGRESGSRSAADVVADEHVEVVSPVDGRVLRAGSYVLYCDETDNFVAIEPDGMPGFEVKMLHFRGLHVRQGDRVVAGETVIGDGPRRLPFESQVDEHSSSGYGPHVHIEVVDTSIPNVPNGGSGSEDC